jgi:hypothetical protein
MFMPDRMLEGQVALMTGAGRGLGRAFAERLAALGCSIGVHGMREHGPSEYGGSETLSDVARSLAAQFARPSSWPTSRAWTISSARSRRSQAKSARLTSWCTTPAATSPQRAASRLVRQD